MKGYPINFSADSAIATNTTVSGWSHVTAVDTFSTKFRIAFAGGGGFNRSNIFYAMRLLDMDANYVNEESCDEIQPYSSEFD